MITTQFWVGLAIGYGSALIGAIAGVIISFKIALKKGWIFRGWK